MQSCDVDLAALGVLPDPYAALDALREQGPVARLPQDGTWIVLGYHRVREALVDERLTAELTSYLDYQEVRSRKGRESPLVWFTKDPLLRGDPDQLTAVRRCLTRVLSPQAAKSYEPLVEAAVGRVTADFDGRESVDLYGDFGLRVATEVLASLLEIADADVTAFSRYSQAFVKIMAPRRTPLEAARLNWAIASFRRHVDELLARADRGRGGLVSLLLEARQNPDGSTSISDDDIARLLITLMAVGTQSVAAATAHSLITYYGDDEARALYPADADGRWSWTLESLRQRLFILFMVRFAVADLHLDGATIPAGDLVWLSPAAAHRDPEVFDGPTRFDPSRDLTAAMPFGLGAHYCSGAALAKLEVQTAVGHFIDAFPRARTSAGEVRWATDTFSRRPIGARVDIT